MEVPSNNEPLLPLEPHRPDARSSSNSGLHTRIYKRGDSEPTTLGEHKVTSGRNLFTKSTLEAIFKDGKFYWRERFFNGKIPLCSIEPELLLPTNIIGKGGNGIVYKVDAAEIFFGAPKDTFVAVKTIKRNIPERDRNKAIGRLIKEALKQVEVNHKNIIEVLAMDVENGCVVFEYATKGEALSFVKDKPFEVRFKVLCDAANGVQALHENGFILCDLKGENILICDDETVKLTDFGASKPGFTRQPHVSKRYKGTGFMSPPEDVKQIGEEKKYEQATDTWSLGLLMADLLVDIFDHISIPDEKKMEYETVFQYIENVLKNQDAETISTNFQEGFNELINELDIPSLAKEGLKDLFGKCTDPDPDKRITTKDFVQELALIQKNLETTA